MTGRPPFLAIYSHEADMWKGYNFLMEDTRTGYPSGEAFRTMKLCIIKSWTGDEWTFGHGQWLKTDAKIDDTIQGVPKVRSSKFMLHNFWSKLIFIWNCWKMFISLLSICIQNFSNWHALFLSHSVTVAAWSGIQRVDPQIIHFELFYHLVRKGQFNPQTIFV